MDLYKDILAQAITHKSNLKITFEEIIIEKVVRRSYNKITNEESSENFWTCSSILVVLQNQLQLDYSYCK